MEPAEGDQVRLLPGLDADDLIRQAKEMWQGLLCSDCPQQLGLVA